MISKQEFSIAAQKVLADFSTALPKMISYKSYIQQEILNHTTRKELEDVRDCRINEGLIDKLCNLAKKEWLYCGDALSLYCAAMAVATIVKEYDWGTHYLVGDGLWNMANRIQCASN